MIKNLKISLLFLLGIPYSMLAQSSFSHEIGGFVGINAMQSDFGTKSPIGSTGFGLGIVHYMNFAYNSECNCYNSPTFFNNHFKVRTELSYNSTKFEYNDKWTDGNSVLAQQLKALKGQSDVTNIGMQLEYYFLGVREMAHGNGSFSPYVGLGMQFSVFKTDTHSELGKLNTPISTPVKYYGAWSDGGGSTFSTVANIGTRYKLSRNSDLFAEVRTQYYFSDWVDGLKPDAAIYTENKSKDMLTQLNFGYIYYLN